MNWLTHFLTFGVVLAFVAGILTGQFVNWLNYRWRKKRHPETVVKRSYWETVIGVLAVVVLVWIMVSTQQARNCAVTLNVAVSNEQAIAKIERDAFGAAIMKSQAVPAEIRALPQNDPAYKAYMDPITAEYLGEMNRAAKLREENKDKQDAAKDACGT